MLWRSNKGFYVVNRQRNRHLMEDIVSPLSTLRNISARAGLPFPLFPPSLSVTSPRPLVLLLPPPASLSISFRARLWSLAAATAAAAAPCPVRRVPPTIQSASLTRFVEHASLAPVVVMAACLKGCLEHCSGCMYGYLSQLYAPRKVNAPLATSETRKSGPSDFFDWETRLEEDLIYRHNIQRTTVASTRLRKRCADACFVAGLAEA
ncbi:hypothetical protein ISCGN_017476 [Ixodes scapularis]